MAKSNQLGFTLIEVVLVIAITGGMLLIAFAGQGQLRAQAHFDAAANKIVSSINDAHNEAAAGVNTAGTGDGTVGCTAIPGVDYVFAGVAWVATPAGDLHIDYYKVIPQSNQASDSCIFATQKIATPVPIQVNIANSVSFQGGKELYIRNNDVLNICPVADNNINVAALFRFGSCTEGVLTLNLTDGDGRKGQIEVDKSGLARRIF
jgi:prepilin-type N-terminal cleavage/methylation domain-containing protein